VFVVIFNETVILSTVFRRIELYWISWISLRWEKICCQEKTEGQMDGQRNILKSHLEPFC